MKIENIRLGLATNSSSTHSLIFNLNTHSRDWECANFGWDEFCCNCVNSKKMYLAATLYQNISSSLGDDIARAVVESWVKPDFIPTEFYGVDHQSLMILPINVQTQQPDKEFFEELMSYYMNSNIAIVGGNDNEEHKFFTTGRQQHILPTDIDKKTHICRKDPNTGHWVLFNKSNGTKIRMHFNKNAPKYTKAFAPELVDIKITEFCPINCSYCYQDSTKNGIHGNRKDIEDIAYILSKIGVFEVALGGGEPTMHPDFTKILKRFRYLGVIPNFTTRSYKWLTDNKIKDAVKKYVGKFAISVSRVQDMERAWHLADEFHMSNADYDYKQQKHDCRIGFQYVMGSTCLSEFKKLIQKIPYGCEMTLLGYKKTGRGSNYKPYEYNGWLQIIKEEANYAKIGIDTALANQFKDEVLKAIDEHLVTFEEGKFSMYIDAVKQLAAPSSYCSDEEYVDIKNIYNKNDWLKLFAKF